jgi:hypothetical protein
LKASNDWQSRRARLARLNDAAHSPIFIRRVRACGVSEVWDALSAAVVYVPSASAGTCRALAALGEEAPRACRDLPPVTESQSRALGVNPRPALIRRRRRSKMPKVSDVYKSDIPIERASKFQLILNRKTANALGFELPMATLLRADEVIE